MTQIPIFRSLRYSHRYELVEYLSEHGYWTAVDSDATPLLTNHCNLQWRDDHSEIHREFSWRAKWWIEWSDQYSDMAATLWPQVLQILRSDQEWGSGHACQLMFLARQAETAAEFRQFVAADTELMSVMDMNHEGSSDR